MVVFSHLLALSVAILKRLARRIPVYGTPAGVVLKSHRRRDAPQVERSFLSFPFYLIT